MGAAEITLGSIGTAASASLALWQLATRRKVSSFEARLREVAVEHEIRFSALHQKRVEILAELYARLVRAERAMAALTQPWQDPGEPSKEQRAEEAAHAGNEFRTHFLENRVWLEPETAILVGDFDAALSSAFETFGKSAQQRSGGYGGGAYGTGTYAGLWAQAWKEVTDRVPTIREEIETRFRELLGVTAKQQETTDTLKRAARGQK